MKYDIFVSTVHGEKTPVDVEKLEKLENMTIGEFSRKGLDGADQSEDYRPASITRDLQDHQTLQDYDFKDLTGLRPTEHKGRRIPRTRSKQSSMPTMQQEEEEEEDEEYSLRPTEHKGRRRAWTHSNEESRPTMQQEEEEEKYSE